MQSFVVPVISFLVGVVASSAFPPVGTAGSKIYAWIKAKVAGKL